MNNKENKNCVQVGLGVVVEPRRGEKIESLLKRFKFKAMQSGVMKEVRNRRYFVSPSERRRQKSKAARRRAIREAMLEEMV